MTLIFDGYNLLHASGIVGGGIGPGGLARARLALLNFLVESLETEELARSTVVFDAHDAPAGMPRTLTHRGLTVMFSAGHEDADALIEELIRGNSAPRRLTVVSSDHRLQRAARRRRAAAIDSDLWYAQAVSRRARRARRPASAAVKPATPISRAEVEYWLDQFDGRTELLDSPADDQIFPPGYAEDAFDEES